MVNAGQASAAPRIRCRPIADADLDSLADLLKRGFGARRTRAFWRSALARLQGRAVPPDMPRYGYLLENDGVAVGAILLIFATTPGGDALRANVSSWYVEPAFRSYAPLLVSQALKLKQVTYLNISAAPHTWPILEAQGYRRYSNGIFVALPALQRASGGDMRLVAADQPPDARHEPFERDLLLAHAAYGCISFWCATRGRAHPFVFRPRRVRSVIPCAQLIYCREVADVARFAGPIGRFLAVRGRPFVVIDANGPIDGLIGHYLDRTMPKFFRGPVQPRLGDLAHTETALFGL
jgi:plasmid stabilization system protein ParE